MNNGRADRPITSEELSFLTVLSESVVADVGRITGVDLSHDLLTIRKRVASEGFPFLSKTLPKLAANLLDGLESGRFTSPSNFAFKRYGSAVTALPAFLSGLLKRVFDEKSGEIRSEADPGAIWGVRQVCNLYYKYEIPYTPEQLDIAYGKVVVTDASLFPVLPEYPSTSRKGLLLFKARNLLLELFSGFDLRQIVPRNGSGACNSQLVHRQSDKYEFIRALPDDTEKCYPVDVYFSPSLACRRSSRAGERLYLPLPESTHGSLSFSRRSNNKCDRHTVITAVNKDSRGPRVIGKENPELQALQQGQRLALQDWLVRHPLTRGHINFEDQTINGQLALSSSKTRQYATLDMSDASDRVSDALVRRIFPADVYEMLSCTRSTHAELPWRETTIRLKKFSPMGSGVCFPVESIVFWALSVAALMVLGADKADALENVYVYGDDTLVPSDVATSVMKLLSAFQLKYNRSKCFIKGHFRESCGVDAFNGVDVTPLRLKKRLPTQISDANAIVAWVAYANNFLEKQMYRSFSTIREYVDKIPNLGHLPSVRPTAGVLGWHDATPKHFDPRWRPERISKKSIRAWAATDGTGENKTHQRWLEVVDNGKSWTQGMEILAWYPIYETYEGSDHDLGEYGRYYRFVTERSRTTDRFGERYTLYLKKKRYVET